jgi:hypothetical protein
LKVINNEMNKFLLPLFASLLMAYSSQGQQATPTPHDPANASDATGADNTKRNSSEQNKNTETAEKQSNNNDDLVLTQKVRQAVMIGRLPVDEREKRQDHRPRWQNNLEGARR